MEIFFPPNHDPAKSKVPGIILFHGGSWSGGTLDAIFSGSSYALNDLLFILLNDGTDAITDTYTGLAQGDTVTSYGGFAWQISYTANSRDGTFIGGNDIALRAIPEPSSVMVAGIGLAMLLGRRSRSRKNDNNA
jgi:hypothetical protein